MVKKCLSRMSGKLSRTVLRRGKGSNPFSLVDFVSKSYVEATPAAQCIRSYSNKANPWDNACIESFHALIKREWLNRFVIKNLKHAHELIFEYIEAFYNTVRIHEYCGMKSPHDYENTFAS
jgi:putative transposase